MRSMAGTFSGGGTGNDAMSAVGRQGGYGRGWRARRGAVNPDVVVVPLERKGVRAVGIDCHAAHDLGVVLFHGGIKRHELGVQPPCDSRIV